MTIHDCALVRLTAKEAAVSLKRPGRVWISIFDVGGRRVFQLSQLLPASVHHRIFFTGAQLPDSIYILKIFFGKERIVRSFATKALR